MAAVFVSEEQPELTARLIGWADPTLEKLGDPRPFIEQADIDKIMGESACSDAYNKGKTIALEEAVAYVVGEVEV